MNGLILPLRRLAPVTAALALATALAGCSGGATSSASSAMPAGSAAPGGSASAAASSGTTQEKGMFGLGATVTKSEVQDRESKKKIPFSIELPEGLSDFSEIAEIKTFSKVKGDLKDIKTYDGYRFMVMSADPRMVKMGLEESLAVMTKGGDFEKNHGKILDKGTTSDGWFFSSSIEEDDGNQKKGKKALLSMQMVTKGETSLQCRGSYEGAEIDKPEEVAATLVKVCKTLKITDG